MLLQQLINGLAQGSLFALIAISFALVWGLLKMVNFALGEVYMLGAYAGWLVVTHVTPNLGLALLAGFAVGWGSGWIDRTGAMDGRGRFVDPHAIFALALRYLVERRGLRGTVVKSVSMTRMVDRLCERHGLPLKETPVGFGYISDLMAREDVLIDRARSGRTAAQPL